MAGASDERCAPAAVVEGLAEVAGSVMAELRRRGLAAQAGPGCRAVHARVIAARGAIVVQIEDGYGRRSEREVGTPQAVATLVETWARPVISAPPSAPEPPPLEPPAVTAALAMAPAAAEILPFGLGASPEAARGSDGSLALGGSIDGCFRIGRFCAGARLRSAREEILTRTRTTRRLGFEMLLGSSFSIPLGRTVLLPSTGIGLGWLRTNTRRGTGEGEDQSSDSDSGGMRLESMLTLALPIARRTWLTVGVGAELVPFTRNRNEQDDTQASDPWGYLRTGVGLRWGAP